MVGSRSSANNNFWEAIPMTSIMDLRRPTTYRPYSQGRGLRRLYNTLNQERVLRLITNLSWPQLT